MKQIEKKIFLYLIIHIFIGIGIYYFNLLVFPYFAAVLFFGTLWVMKTNDNNFQVLMVISYILGLEVLFRMKSNGVLYDLGKYSVIYFCFLGYFFKKIDIKSWPYILIFLLFIPGIILTVNTFFFEIDVRKKIMFNLLGEFALITTSLYCYNKEIVLKKIIDILLICTGPLLAILINLILYTPSNLKEVITGTSSNFATSGGFGPNQMSVILGLGSFLFFMFFLLRKDNLILKCIYLFLFFIFSYRGLLTFSRGGMMTSIAMLVVFLFTLQYVLDKKNKLKLYFTLIFSLFLSLIVWTYTSIQTDGMIDKRYKNQDGAGRVKESQLTGREDIMMEDIKLFIENPVFGVGAGISSSAREYEGVVVAQAHSEPTRLLSEHGSLGLVILIILIFVPIFKWLRYRQFQNIFFTTFMIFWGLTINHAATRIVAPSVIYALTLLNVKLIDDEKEDTLPR